MAEFWPEDQAEPSSAKIHKPPGSTADEPAAVQSNAQDPPTVLSSFRASSISQEPQSLMASELAGEMLGHFRLDDYIGVGGMGAVFRARPMSTSFARPLGVMMMFDGLMSRWTTHRAPACTSAPAICSA